MQAIIRKINDGFQINGAVLSYPHLFEAQAVASRGQPPSADARKSFSGVFMIPPDTDISELWGNIQQVANLKFPDGLPPQFNWPIRKSGDGSHSKDDPRFKDWWVLTGKRPESQGKPVTLDGTQQAITDPGVFYPGCLVIVFLKPYAYDNVSRGVNLGLEGVMFQADGERLDNRTDAATMFEGALGGVPNAGMGQPPAPTASAQTLGNAPLPGTGTTQQQPPNNVNAHPTNINPVTGEPYA